jgi:mRNA-degrading endonuclease RelE of RelBE toxin-antitoxin system
MRSRSDLLLKSLALRQQLATFVAKRRPGIRPADRGFRVISSRAWTSWTGRSGAVVVENFPAVAFGICGHLFEIRFAEGAFADLDAVPAFRRSAILDAIERRLGTTPLAKRRSRKELVGLVPPWDQVRPVWELKVGEYRVFYDVDEGRALVIVQAVRRKGRKRTGEIP